MTLYMEVTQDEYELPVAIADTVAGLAKLRNVCPSCISKSIHHSKKQPKYVKVEIDEDE